MEKVIEHGAVVEGADIAAAEALLGDLEIGTEEVTMEHIGELDAGAEDAVEQVIAKDEAYADQPGSGTGGIEATAAEPAAPAKTKRAKSAKAPKAKIARDLSDLPALTFSVNVGDAADAGTKDAMIALRPTQKKIAEKFDNLFVSIAAGKKPSVYTMACLNALKTAKTVTSTDLVGALKAATVGVGKSKGATYNEGTARSQAGQMMALFAVVGIATRVKQTLTFNPNSAIAAKLSALA